MKRTKPHRNLAALAVAALASSGLAACDVDVNDKGDLPDVDVQADAGNLPEYEVKKVEDGRLPDVDVDVAEGDLPDVDVQMADLNVGTKKKTVEVPKLKVVIEEEEVEVPYVDVDMPNETDDAKITDQVLTVKLPVPDATYDVEIEEIYLVEDELWVLSKVEGQGDTEVPGRQAMDTVVVKAPELEVKHYVVGPKIDGADDYVFVANKTELDADLSKAKRVYVRS